MYKIPPSLYMHSGVNVHPIRQKCTCCPFSSVHRIWQNCTRFWYFCTSNPIKMYTILVLLYIKSVQNVQNIHYKCTRFQSAIQIFWCDIQVFRWEYTAYSEKMYMLSNWNVLNSDWNIHESDQFVQVIQEDLYIFSGMLYIFSRLDVRFSGSIVQPFRIAVHIPVPLYRKSGLVSTLSDSIVHLFL